MRGSIIFILMVFILLVFLVGCNKQLIKNNPNVTGSPTGPQCPESCDDGNKCTQDVCNEQTDFECRTVPISPCCGNGVCEQDETPAACASDCTGESPEFKQLITNSANVNSYSYRYEYFVAEDNSEILKDAYLLKNAGNYTLIEHDELQKRGTFNYNRVFINGSSNTATLYCLKNCGPNTLAMTAPAQEFIKRKPTEILYSLRGVTVIGNQNVDGKPATIVTQKNTNGTSVKVSVLTFFGVPLVVEEFDAQDKLITKTRYKNLIVNGIYEYNVLPPKDLVFS